MRADGRRLLWGVAAVASLAGCGEGFGAALLVSFTGATGAAGGGYRIELRQADGALLPGTEGVFVDFQPGDQEVSVVLESSDLFSGADSALARIYVEVWAAAEGPATALGSKLVTLERGRVTELDLPLAADPRPWEAELTVRYVTGSDEGIAIRVESSGEDDLDSDYSLHVWSEIDGATTWLGASEALAGTQELPLADDFSLAARAGESIRLTLEPGTETDPLAASNGWLVARGELPEAVRIPLEPALDEAMPGLLALAGHAALHAGFAASAFVPGNPADAQVHAEHTYNIASGRDGEDDFGDGVIDYSGVTDDTGIEAYRADALAAATAAAEAVVDGVPRAAFLSDAVTCSAELIEAVGALRSSASSFINAGSSATELQLQTMVADAQRLRGDPFDPNADGPEIDGQTGLCLLDRLEAVTTFGLEVEDPSAL